MPMLYSGLDKEKKLSFTYKYYAFTSQSEVFMLTKNETKTIYDLVHGAGREYNSRVFLRYDWPTTARNP